MSKLIHMSKILKLLTLTMRNTCNKFTFQHSPQTERTMAECFMCNAVKTVHLEIYLLLPVSLWLTYLVSNENVFSVGCLVFQFADRVARSE